MSMDFTFKMLSIKSGWIEIEAICQERSFLMNVCDKSDPIDELLEMLIRLNALCVSCDDSSDTPYDGIYLFWEGRDSQYTLKFTPLKDRIVKIEISYCANINAGINIRDFKEISGEVRLDMLIKSVYNEILAVLKKFGFAGYRAEWRKSSFPICFFLRLYRVINMNSTAPGAEGFLSELAALREISASLK